MTVEQVRAELAEVARLAGSRLRSQNHLHPLALEPFDQACRFTRERRWVSWATNGSLFLIEAAASSAIVFAAGRPDPIVGARHAAGVTAGAVIFDVEDTRVSPAVWLADLEHSSLITKLQLAASEQLLIARNRVILLAEPRGIEADWNRLGDLLRLVDALPPDEAPPGSGELIDRLRFDVAAVPARLRPLLPMLRRWALSDDRERSERIEAASREDLAGLIEAVSPQITAIDGFINSQGEPLPDEALLLGALAEATLEARDELERRDNA